MRGGASPTLYNGFADFLLGLPQSMGKDLQFVNPASVRMPSWGFYARDQWQINRQLTLNYGLRYEYYPFATRADRGGERYDPITDKVLVGGLGGVPTNAGVCAVVRPAILRSLNRLASAPPMARFST